MRISTPNYAPGLVFDTLIVRDGIQMSVKLIDRQDYPSLDITADAAVMDLINIDWSEMQNGIFGGRRTLSLSLSLKELWHDCVFDVNAVLEIGTHSRFSYIEAVDARVTVDTKALASELTIRAYGASYFTTTGSAMSSIVKKTETIASGQSVVDIHQVPLDYAKAVAHDQAVVTIKANKRVDAECSGQSYIGVQGKPLVQKQASDDCEIAFGWTSWAKGMLKRLVIWTIKSIGMAIGLRLLIVLVVICGLMSVFGCSFLVPMILLSLVLSIAFYGVLLMAFDLV